MRTRSSPASTDILVLAAVSPAEISFIVTGFPRLVASRSWTVRRLTGSGGLHPVVVSTNKSQNSAFDAPFTFTSILYRLPRRDARAFCGPNFMPHRRADVQNPCNFLSLVNALFTTLGEMWARRLPVFILYRIFTVFRSAGGNPGSSPSTAALPPVAFVPTGTWGNWPRASHSERR